MSNLKKIDGGVTTPQGFTAGAVYTAIKKRENKKPDVAVLYSDLPCSCAACFTTNKFCAAPVILDREILKKGKARAVVINSGNANAATGNEVLDVVLTEKSLLCESRGIQLNAVANGSCLGFFEAGDLYALFANALDHAVESAVQVSRPECRVIDLLVCVRQGFVVVNIISPLRPPEQQANRSAQYELKVIRRIVQKYKGTLTLEEQGEFFAEKIIFPLQK